MGRQIVSVLALVAATFVACAASSSTVAAPPVPAPAPPNSPQTLRDDPALKAKVEERGRLFVQAVNAGDEEERRQVAGEIFTPKAVEKDGITRTLALFDRIQAQFGELQFHHAEAVAGETARFWLHVYAKSAKDGRWHDFQFQLEATPPHLIVSIVFVAEVSEPIYLPNGEITNPDTRSWLNGYVDKLHAGDDLSGSLLIAQSDSVIFQRTFGYADAQRQHLIGPRTRFNTGSGGKMFTALCVARLVQRGALRFTDTLSQVVPALRNQAFARRVTIAQLLSHTSGVGEYWTDDYEKHRGEIRTLSDFLPFVLAAGVRFPAGTQFEYSNSNYILAGLALEAATGKPYDEIVNEEIFKPLGMRDTGLFLFEVRDTLQAQPLRRDGEGWSVARSGVKGSSAGGCLTTLPDMLKFGRALAAGKIVPPEMLATMTASKTEGLPGDGTSYGYGFILQNTRDGVTSYGHGGITSGVNFEFRHFSPGDITLIALSNQDNGAYDDLRRNTTKLITGER